MDVPKIAALLDELAEKEARVHRAQQSKLVLPNGVQPEKLQVSQALIATGLINCHIRLRNIELHLGIIEPVQPEPERKPS